MDPISGFDIRLVFTLPPKEITFLALVPWHREEIEAFLDEI